MISGGEDNQEDHELFAAVDGNGNVENDFSEQAGGKLKELQQSEELPPSCSIFKDLVQAIKPPIEIDNDEEDGPTDTGEKSKSKPPSYDWFPMGAVSFADVMATQQNPA